MYCIAINTGVLKIVKTLMMLMYYFPVVLAMVWLFPENIPNNHPRAHFHYLYYVNTFYAKAPDISMVITILMAKNDFALGK